MSFDLVAKGSVTLVDWAPCLSQIMERIREGADTGAIAAAFHATMAEAIAAVARCIGEPQVVLTAGCFQNATLLEAAVGRLRASG